MKKFETNEEFIYTLIIDDLDDTITPDHKQLLEQWRADAEANEKTYQDFRNVQLSMDKLYSKNGRDPQLSWEVLDKKISRQQEPAVLRLNRKTSPIWYKVAAAALIILGLGYYFILGNQYVVVSTDSNTAITHLILPDGTDISLNAGTKIKYNKDFKNNRKLQLLKGEVFINVVQHNGPQFKVDLGEVEAEDIGTSFNITKNEKKVTVIVEDGKVALRHVSLDLQVSITPGKLGVYNTDTKQIHTGDNLNVNYKSWLDKKFIFDEVPVNQVVDELQKVYQMPIDIKGASLKNRKLTAQLHYKTIDSALAVISASLQCKLTREKNAYVLSDN